eukprot:10979973-Prorocentrum_lima.AAC.1
MEEAQERLATSEQVLSHGRDPPAQVQDSQGTAESSLEPYGPDHEEWNAEMAMELKSFLLSCASWVPLQAQAK